MESLTFGQFYQRLMKWATDRDLLTADPRAQYMKISEEFGEIAEAFNKQDNEKLKDSIGDVYVATSIFCMQVGMDPETCFNYAWDQIKYRKGKTINGAFVKESDLKTK